MKEVGVDLDLPHTFTVGWYQRLRGDLKRIALMADYSYTLWSSFDMLSIEGSGTPGVKEDWRNTSRVAFGVPYLSVRFRQYGFAFWFGLGSNSG